MTEFAAYSRTAMALHWLVALLIAVNVALGWSVYCGLVADDSVRPVINAHKSIGITVLGLAVLRVLWRISHPAPAFPRSYQRWERVSAHAAHVGLYVLIFALPLSGWMHDSAWKDAATHPMSLFGTIPWPRIGLITSLDPTTKEHLHALFGAWHQWLGYALYVLFAAHVLGALKHQFIDKEPELQRMLP